MFLFWLLHPLNSSPLTCWDFLGLPLQHNHSALVTNSFDLMIP